MLKQMCFCVGWCYPGSAHSGKKKDDVTFLRKQARGCVGRPKGSQAEKQAARLGDLRGEVCLAFCPFETTSVHRHDLTHKPGSGGCRG